MLKFPICGTGELHFFFKVYKSSISLCEITGVMVSVLLLPSSPATKFLSSESQISVDRFELVSYRCFIKKLNKSIKLKKSENLLF